MNFTEAKDKAKQWGVRFASPESQAMVGLMLEVTEKLNGNIPDADPSTYGEILGVLQRIEANLAAPEIDYEKLADAIAAKLPKADKPVATRKPRTVKK